MAGKKQPKEETSKKATRRPAAKKATAKAKAPPTPSRDYERLPSVTREIEGAADGRIQTATGWRRSMEKEHGVGTKAKSKRGRPKKKEES